MSESETQLQIRVARYLVENYPDVPFHSDYGAGVKLTKRQAATQKAQNGSRKGWPDMFIAQSKVNYIVRRTDEDGGSTVKVDFGLFLELKKEGTRLKKKNGEWASDHIAEQAEVMMQLRAHGYMAEFAVGFDEAKELIDEYLGGGEAEGLEEVEG